MNGEGKTQASAESAANNVDIVRIKKLYARAKTAYLISYISVVAVLFCNVLSFSLSETLGLIKRFSDSPFGISVSFDLLLLIFFIFGVPLWGLLRFKAWASAGAALVAAYCFPTEIEFAGTYFAMSALLGFCTLPMKIFLSLVCGLAAFAASVYLGYLQFI